MDLPGGFHYLADTWPEATTTSGKQKTKTGADFYAHDVAYEVKAEVFTSNI